MSDQKHTVEDVLAQYAQTAEGAAHLAEIEQGKTKANTRKAPSVENVQTAQEHFAEQVADAKARPSMREAHAIRQDELKKEIQDYVKHHTAPYKYPRIVEFRDELP